MAGVCTIKSHRTKLFKFRFEENLFPTYDRKSTDVVAHTHLTTYIFALSFSFVYKLW
jgi:hypothetical protein